MAEGMSTVAPGGNSKGEQDEVSSLLGIETTKCGDSAPVAWVIGITYPHVEHRLFAGPN